jgi:uncharacterized protein with von Willebrand factor type A (vWA) domain
MSYLLHNLIHFGELLHALGLDVHAGRIPAVAAALEHVNIGNKTDFFYTLRTLMVHRHQDLAAFDDAFRTFWRKPRGDRVEQDLRALGEQRRFGNPQVTFPAGASDLRLTDALPTLAEMVKRTAPTSYSPNDVLRTKDFAELTDEEFEQARSILSALTWTLGERRTRRWIPGNRGNPDFRRMFRRNLKYGAEPVEIPKREPRPERRPLVLLCDVSGSMERYSRMLLHFIYGLAGGIDRVEAFLFATRLTRITRELSSHPDKALFKITRHVPDWSGGTRIGEALRSFNLHWGRRVLAHGPVVLLISDGWDRGDPELLRQEISRLRRTCYRLIWLNPLLGSAEYEPLTRGMQAALPFVDDFLPVHNLDSLEALANHLNTLPARRGRVGARKSYPE